MICHHVNAFTGWVFGDNNHIQFGDVNSIDYDDPLTISGWITLGSGGAGNIVTKYTSDDLGANTRRGWAWQVPLTGRVRFYLGHNLGLTIQLVVDTSTTITDGVEHHVVIVYNENRIVTGKQIGRAHV